MKRILALFLTIIIVIFPLTACKKKPVKDLTSQSESDLLDDEEDGEEVFDEEDEDEDEDEGGNASSKGKSASSKSKTTSSKSKTTSSKGKTTSSIDINKDKEDFGGRTFKIVYNLDGKAPKSGSSEYADYLIKRTKELEKAWNFKLEYYFPGVIEDGYTQTVLAACMSRDPIGDVIFLPDYNLFSFIRRGLAYPVSDLNLFTDEDYDKYGKSGEPLVTKYKNKQYVIPFSLSPISIDVGDGVFFNKKIFERLGLDNPYHYVENNTWNYDNMFDLAQKTAKDTNGDGQIDQYGLAGKVLSMSFIYGNGGQIERPNADGSKYTFTLNEPKALRGVEAFVNNKSASFWAPHEQDGKPLFVKGNLAMYIDNLWVNGEYFSAGKMNDAYGWVPFPKGPDATKYSMNAISGRMFIPANVKDAAAIGKIIKYIYNAIPYDTLDEAMEIGSEQYQDAKMVKYIKESIKNNYTVYSATWALGDLFGIVNGAIWSAGGGSQSVAAAIEAIRGPAEKAISDALGG